jgi:hypothetical protein
LYSLEADQPGAWRLLETAGAVPVPGRDDASRPPLPSVAGEDDPRQAGAMSLLKKIGIVSINLAGIIAGVGPLIAPGRGAAIAGALDVFQEVLGAIATVEQIGAAVNLDGAAKFKAAIPLMGQIVGRSHLVRTHGIKDQALYAKAMEGLAQSGVDLLNSLDSKKVKTEDLGA